MASLTCVFCGSVDLVAGLHNCVICGEKAVHSLQMERMATKIRMNRLRCHLEGKPDDAKAREKLNQLVVHIAELRRLEKAIPKVIKEML